MRRWAALATVVIVVATTASMADGASASLRTKAVRISSRVGPGTTWVLWTGGTCETESFGADHTFTATGNDTGIGIGNGDQGSYKLDHENRNRLTMTWTAGANAGGVFHARFSRDVSVYGGPDTVDGHTELANLDLISYRGACPAVTSTLDTSSTVFGDSDGVVVTVTGAGGVTPTGNVQFWACPDVAGPCDPNAVDATDLGTDLLVGSGDSATASSGFTPRTPGRYCFADIYNGDSHYGGSVFDASDNLCFTVAMATPGVTATPALGQVLPGGSDTDAATVTGTGAFAPTGTVTFYVCGPASSPVPCTTTTGAEVGSPVDLGPSVGSPPSATVTSGAFTPTATGTYCFLAVYSGDTGYLPGSAGSTTDQCVSVNSDTQGPPIGIVALNKVAPHEVLSGGTGRFVVAGDLFLNTRVINQPWSSSDGIDEWDDAIDAKTNSAVDVYGTIFSSSALGTGQYAGQPLWPLDTCFIPEGRQAGGPGGPFYPTSENPSVQLSCTESGGSSTFDYNGLQNDWAQFNDPFQAAGAPPSPVGSTVGCPGMAPQTFGPLTQVPGTTTQLMPGTYTAPVDLTGDAVLNDCPGGYPGIYNFDAGLAIDPQAGASVTGTDIVIATQSPYPMADNVPGSLVNGVFVPNSSGNGAPCLPLTTMTSPSSGDGTPMPEATVSAPCGGTHPQTYGVVAYSDQSIERDPSESGTGDNFSLVVGGAGSVTLTGPTSGVYGGVDGLPGIVLYQDPDTQANYGFDAEAGDSAVIQINGVVYNASLENYGADAPLDYWDGIGGGVPFYAGGTLQAGDGTGWSDGPPESAGSVTLNGSAVVDDFNTDGATTLTIVGQPYSWPAGTTATAARSVASAHRQVKGPRRFSRHRGGRRGRGGSR